MFWKKKKCPIDAGKTECSLIQELRQLQEDVDKVKLKKPEVEYRYTYFSDSVIYGIIVSEFGHEEEHLNKLKKVIENTEYNIRIKKEINDKKERIKEIKEELGII